MKINLKLFGRFIETFHINEKEIDLQSGATVLDLLNSLCKTDKQRGNGVFDKSITALKQLNDVGYGLPGSDLRLDLVYNPSGAFLPGDQAALEKDFKKALKEDFDIDFHNLFAITKIA